MVNPRQVITRIVTRLCRPFFAWRLLLALLVLTPILLLHLRRSTPSTSSRATSPKASLKQARWTSWLPDSGDASQSSCPQGWEKDPDLEDLKSWIPEQGKGALILPWVNTAAPIIKPTSVLCGWVVITGKKNTGEEQLVQTRASEDHAQDTDPPQPGNDGDEVLLPHLPPDSISIVAVGKQHGFEIPIEVSENYVRYMDAELEYRLYDVVTILRDPDTYTLEASLEYNDYITTTTPYPLPVFINGDRSILENIQVQGKPISRSTYLGLAHCLDSDHPGRWVNGSILAKSPVASSWISEEDEVHEDLTEQLQSYEGRVWVPYDCRYRRWTYKAFRDKCLTKWYTSSIFIGDANIRRALKALATGGAWCREWYDERSHQCQCDDSALTVPQIRDKGQGWNAIQKVAGSNATILYASIDTLSRETWLDPSITTFGQSAAPHSAEAALGSQIHTSPSLVVVNLPTHDLSSTTPLSTIIATIQSLTTHLRLTYALHAIPIIIRTPQHTTSPSNRLRTKLISRYFSRTLSAALRPLTSVHVWDVHHISESAPRDAQHRFSKCEQGHSPRDLVDWENSVLMNVMCNKQMADEKRVVFSLRG